MFDRFRPLGSLRSHDPNADVVLDRGMGHLLWDTQGKEYIDFIGGYSAMNLGHGHPRLVAAAQSQLTQLTFCTGNQSKARSELEAKLAGLFQGVWGNETVKVWLSTTGSRAVEIAWKIAVSNRPGRLMRFDLGFHGRSLATALISDTARCQAIDCNISGTQSAPGIVPYPLCGSACGGTCAQCDASIAIAEAYLREHSHETSAMIVEPAIGSRGYYFASNSYYRRLASLMRKNGVLLISDEVQMGLGRMGSMIASVAGGWVPDLVLFGKSLGGGITPISCVVGRNTLMDRLPEGIESETFAATAFACRIACEVIAILNEETFLEKVLTTGERFRQELRRVLPPNLIVDGRGLATAVSMTEVESPASPSGDDNNLMRTSTSDWMRKWVAWARQNGLLVHLTSAAQNRVAILPPLSVDESTMHRVVQILSSFWNNK